MKIAVIGWGSLIWCPGELRISSRWHKDGPLLPIEFTRVSTDGRLTLVITPGVKKIQTLWALSEFGNFNDVRGNLQKREETIAENINFAFLNQNYSDLIQLDIKNWLQDNKKTYSLVAAVWTNLPPKKPKNLNNNKFPMTESDAIKYVSELQKDNDSVRQQIKRYVRNTPEQIETAIRRRFRENFGWENNKLSPSFFEQ